jgi:hypothetical protein
VKKQLPLLLGFLAGSFALAEFYIPAAGTRTIMTKLLEFAQVLAASAFVLGGISVLQVNVPHIRRRRPDWPYKVVLLVGAALMGLAGIRWHTFGAAPEPGQLSVTPASVAGGGAVIAISADRPGAEVSLGGLAFEPIGEGYRRPVEPGAHSVTIRMPIAGYGEYRNEAILVAAGETVTVRARLVTLWGPSGRVYTWMYDHLFAPCNATMFALLAFFIASAAFRAFRARNVEAALLLAAAILIMIGRVPLGRALSERLPWIADWIIDVPNNAGRRAIMMGAALGAIATGLRVILGLERSHLGRDS